MVIAMEEKVCFFDFVWKHFVNLNQIPSFDGTSVTEEKRGVFDTVVERSPNTARTYSRGQLPVLFGPVDEITRGVLLDYHRSTIL